MALHLCSISMVSQLVSDGGVGRCGGMDGMARNGLDYDDDGDGA